MANSRALNQALEFKQNHKYGKQLVDNVTVGSRPDALQQAITPDEGQVAKSTEQCQQNAQALQDQQKQLRRAERRQETVSHQLQKRLNNGESVTPPTQRLAVEQTELTQQPRKQKLALERLVDDLRQPAHPAHARAAPASIRAHAA